MQKIIVAEDEREISTLISLTLRMEGYEVVQAIDGEEALQMARTHHPDLVLLDVMMPKLSGYDVARELQNDPRTALIPIIFVTARHEMEDRVLGLGMAIDYICKPFVLPELVARVRAALRIRQLQEELRISNERLSRLAVTDGLTGLCNRRGFEDELQEELSRARRFSDPLAVVMFDIDHFKQINDTWGHPRGDIVLQAFSKVLQQSSRRIDKVARIGGEEFVALLPTTDLEGARTFAEKVREQTAALCIPGEVNDGKPAQELRLTVSAGVAVAEVLPFEGAGNAELADTLIKQADVCLYRAKTGGRNRVEWEVLADIGSLSSPS